MAAVVVAVVAVAGSMVVTACGSAARHPGGDPDGRLMAEMVPLVRVVPGFERGRIPWVSSDCNSCNFPTKYATKVEPHWDSRDGIAGTFGWDPAIIGIGLVWTRSPQSLVATLNSRLETKGWIERATPSWSEDQVAYQSWDFLRAGVLAETFTLDSPVDGLGWRASLEAKPVGTLAGGR